MLCRFHSSEDYIHSTTFSMEILSFSETQFRSCAELRIRYFRTCPIHKLWPNATMLNPQTENYKCFSPRVLISSGPVQEGDKTVSFRRIFHFLSFAPPKGSIGGVGEAREKSKQKYSNRWPRMTSVSSQQCPIQRVRRLSWQSKSANTHDCVVTASAAPVRHFAAHGNVQLHVTEFTFSLFVQTHTSDSLIFRVAWESKIASFASPPSASTKQNPRSSRFIYFVA